MSVTTSPSTTTSSQARTLEAILAHHAQLQQAVAIAATAVQDAAERLGDLSPYRDEFVQLLRSDILPHAAAEEETLYRAGGTLVPTRLVVQAMVAEHRTLQRLVDELAAARTPSSIVAVAYAVRVLFEAHLVKENDQLLPSLVLEGIDLAGLLEGMHDILGDEADEMEQGGCGCGGCGCGGGQQDAPTGWAQPGDLDVRSLPHAQRHERIFAMFGELEPGEAFILANDHDPKPLRFQLEAMNPGGISWDYLEQGPELWRVQVGRLA